MTWSFPLNFSVTCDTYKLNADTVWTKLNAKELVSKPDLTSSAGHLFVTSRINGRSTGGVFFVHVTTQEMGYCIETATQGETPFLSHNGKHQTYQRAPCESETGVEHHGAKDTLTTTDRVPRDNAAPLDDNRTNGISGAGDSTERNLVLYPHANHNHSHHRATAQAQTPCHPSTLTTVYAALSK